LKIIHFLARYMHAKMASRKIETYQIELRTYALTYLNLATKAKSFLKTISD